MISGIFLRDLVSWTRAIIESPANLEVRAISTDTRQIQPGDIYLALKGDHFDGHRFLAEAVSKGASALISEQPHSCDIPVLKVENTLQAFSQIGHQLRTRFKGPTIGVVGSAGKSSTKEMITTLLGKSAFCSPASYNNLIGLSKTLCMMPDGVDYLVLEIGMNAGGEITELCQLFLPNYGVLTNIGDAHIGKLGSAEALYRAKKEFFDFLSSSALSKGVALNNGDEKVKRAFGTSSLPRIAYRSDGEGDCAINVLKKCVDPNTAHLNLALNIEGDIFELELPIFGLHHAQNIVAAIATVRLLQIPIEIVKKRLLDIRPATHRGEIHQLKDNITLIDESYNANPSATISALDSLSQLDSQRKRFVVLGDMRELGQFSEKLHGEVAQHLVNLQKKHPRPLRVLCVGTESKAIAQLLRQQLSDLECYEVETAEQAIEQVDSKLQKGEILFLKASNGVGLGRVVLALQKRRALTSA